MLVSFVIFSSQDVKHFFRTMNSILQQDSDDFELIVIEDSGFTQNSMVLEGLTEKQKEIGERMHVLVNIKGQGNAYGINTAIRYAKGQYVIFVYDNQSFDKTFVSSLRKIVDKCNVAPDLFEFNVIHSDNDKLSMLVKNTQDKLLMMSDHKEIIANVGPELTNKLFKLSILVESNVHMRNYVWYPTLFLYKYIAQIKTYYASSKLLAAICTSEIKFSVFDLVKQWVHIFNRYRELDLYRLYQEELDYAYSHYLLVDFPNLLISACSHRLVIKALTSAQNKLMRRSRYLLQNPYVVNNSDDEFAKIVADINGNFKKLKETSE